MRRPGETRFRTDDQVPAGENAPVLLVTSAAFRPTRGKLESEKLLRYEVSCAGGERCVRGACGAANALATSPRNPISGCSRPGPAAFLSSASYKFWLSQFYRWDLEVTLISFWFCFAAPYGLYFGATNMFSGIIGFAEYGLMLYGCKRLALVYWAELIRGNNYTLIYFLVQTLVE